MTSHGDPHATPAPNEPVYSDGDKLRSRTYLREFFPGVIAYGIAVFATAALVGDDPSMPTRLLLLLPLVPAIWSARAIVRSVQRADEFERAMHLESMAMGFATALVAAMVVGLLGMHADPNRFNQVGPWIIFSLGMATWGISFGVRMGRRA